MTGKDLKSGREQKGWTQNEAAKRFGLSQPYLSLMEKGSRPVPEKLARKAASAFGLSAATLPVETNLESVQPRDSNSLARDLAALGYPGFAYLKSKGKKIVSIAEEEPSRGNVINLMDALRKSLAQQAITPRRRARTAVTARRRPAKAGRRGARS